MRGKKPRKKQGLPKQSETDIKRAIKQFLDLRGIWHFHVLQGLGSYKGIPDIFAVTDGWVYAIEVKKPTGKQSEHQKAFERRWRARGHPYILATCVEDVAKHMNLEGL